MIINDVRTDLEDGDGDNPENGATSRNLEHQQHEDQDKAHLHHHHHELRHHMRQHHLQTGDPRDPGPVQQALLPLDDEADAGETHRHEVGDAKDDPGGHELSEGWLHAPVHWSLELYWQTGDRVWNLTRLEHAGGEGLEGLS